MRVVESRRELQELSDRGRVAGHRIALVPTMGALHAGHLSLVSLARERAEQVWASIFVNPTQFENPADLTAYPRTLERDLEACRAAGIDAVFTPSAAELYPENSQTWVEVSELTRTLCGASRPGHFRGVATVVSKLFLAAKPHVAVFGEKDYQQLAVLRRMVADLGFDVEIVGGPIVREADGLALSSRNVRLAPEARRQALALVRALEAAEAAVKAGERSSAALLDLARSEIARAPLARIDYVELCDPDSLQPSLAELDGPGLLALAVYFPSGAGDPVRLIDNRVLRF